MAQLNLFPRKAVNQYPPSTQSADSLGEVEADDQHRYYVKTDSNGSYTRASEWICSSLSEVVGIAAPAFVPIELFDRSVVFGSRRIGGAAAAINTYYYMTSPNASNLVPPNTLGLRSILSAIYALDMFLFNDDRHFGNYLLIDDQGVGRVFAFDYSRSLFWSWPFQGFPNPSTRTRACAKLIWPHHPFDTVGADNVLRKIDALTGADLDQIMSGMPTGWLPAQLRAKLTTWWTNGGRSSRVNDLRIGLSNGTLL